MNSEQLIDEVRSERNLELSFKYAISDKFNTGFFYDPIEIELYNRENFKNDIINELLEKLKNPMLYKPQPCFAFFPSKTELCHRRMIDIPLRDLVLRYSFVIVLSEYLDTKFIDNCFANRREINEKKEQRLLQNFAETSWPNFCDWQIEMSKKYSILLKTDISSFYDSVSHEYLIDIVLKELDIPLDSEFIKLLHRILRLTVYYYNSDNDLIYHTMKQGLATNNNTEGFFANLYLHDIDTKIGNYNISYGRYVDDIRIWGNSENEILKILYNLQKMLLTMGLNLNSTKTKIAKSTKLINKLISEKTSCNYFNNEDEDFEIKQNSFDDEIDIHLNDFNIDYDLSKPIKNSNDAKLFCKKLNFNKNRVYLVPLGDRTVKFIKKLSKIIIHFPNVSKFASWILVHSSFDSNITDEVKKIARKEIINLINNPNVSTYSKYRLIHHITRYQRLNKINFKTAEIDKLKDITKRFINEYDYELKIISIYFHKLTSRDSNYLEEIIKSDELLKLKNYPFR